MGAKIPDHIPTAIGALLAPYLPSMGSADAVRRLLALAVDLRKRDGSGLLSVRDFSKLTGMPVTTIRLHMRGVEPAKRKPCPGGFMALYTMEQLATNNPKE